MQADGLLRTDTPVLVESGVEVRRAEGPERRVPGGALTCWLVRPARDVPAPYHLFDESGFDQTLAVRSAHVAGAKRNAPRVLKFLQDGKGSGQFVGGRRHGLLLNLGFGVVRFLGFSVVLFVGFGVKRFLGYCVKSPAGGPDWPEAPAALWRLPGAEARDP